MRRIFVLLGLLLGVGGAFGAAPGSSVYISPTTVVMSYGTATSSIALRNDSSRPMGFTLRAYRWSNSAEGSPKLEASDEIIVFPATLALAAGETRRIRLGTQVAASATERSYRLVLDEVAGPATARREGLSTLLQFSIPIFVQPKDRMAKVSMPAPELDGGLLHVQLRNVGRLHVTARHIDARGLDGAGTVVWTRTFQPWYLLPEEVRRYTAPLTAAECQATALVVAEATFGESSKLALHEQQKVAGAACGAR